jgi:IS5 family transposase
MCQPISKPIWVVPGKDEYPQGNGNRAFTFTYQTSSVFLACQILDSASSMYNWDITINQHLAAKGLTLKQGTIVDATLINAPSSTNNAKGERDPDMHQTKKGNQWYVGMRAHIGVDAQSDLVHHVHTTPANTADVVEVDHLLRGHETDVFADAGYIGVHQRKEHENRNVNWWIAMRPGRRKVLTDSEDDCWAETVEKVKAKIRAKVEHPFRVIKQQFGFSKARYKGLSKIRPSCTCCSRYPISGAACLICKGKGPVSIALWILILVQHYPNWFSDWLVHRLDVLWLSKM